MMQDVYTLLCKRDLKMAQYTLPKLIASLLPEQRLFVLDDGSFDEETRNNVLHITSQIIIIGYRERENFVTEAIRNHPNCKKYRSELPLAFKLIDIPLLAREIGQRFTFTDSDIIYYNNCEAYFNQTRNTYLRTDAIKLSVKLKNALLKYRWHLPLRFNSGYFSYNTDDYDLDFIEYYLGLPDVRNSPWLSEQTCWSLLFGRAGESYCPEEHEFVCRENFVGPDSNTKAIHLIGQLKGKVSDWSTYKGMVNTNDLQFEKSRNITVTDWAIKSIKRMAG